MNTEKRVIFVCSGNICRSPMAEALLASRSSEQELSLAPGSAGTLGIENHAADPDAIRALEETGLDLKNHRSRAITDELLVNAYAIVVMAPEHEEYLLSQHPDSAGAIVRLWEFCAEGQSAGEIEDPLGRGLDEFRRIRDVVADGLDQWLAALEDR